MMLPIKDLGCVFLRGGMVSGSGGSPQHMVEKKRWCRNLCEDYRPEQN